MEIPVQQGELMIGRHNIFLTVGLVGLIALTATGARASNLVVNGDFANIGSVWVNNTGDGSDDWLTSGATAIPDWTNLTGAANEFWVTNANSYGLTTSPGNGSTFFVDLTGQANDKPYGGIEQTIATTSGDNYVLQFYLGSSTLYNTATNPAALTAIATGSSLLASQLFSLAPTSTNAWAIETLDFTADSSSTTIEFVGDSSYTSEYIGLDNVSVTAATSAVPEPATWPVILIGLIGIGALMRSRRNQVAPRT
jgi:hypothetical protein